MMKPLALVIDTYRDKPYMIDRVYDFHGLIKRKKKEDTSIYYHNMLNQNRKPTDFRMDKETGHVNVEVQITA